MTSPRRFTLALTATATSLALASCGGAGSAPADVPSAPATVTDTRPVLTDAVRDGIYLKVVRDGVTWADGKSDAQVVNVGHQVCSCFDSGMTWIETLKVLVDSGLDGSDSGRLMGSATAAYCPEHNDEASR